MVEFRVKIHEKQRLAYIPQEVVKSLGLELCLVPNFKSAVLYSKDSDLKRVIQSLEIIIADLRLRPQDE